MKRCPECRRDYYDDSLLYCLDDGSALLEGPGSQESPTVLLADALHGRRPAFRKASILLIGLGILVLTSLGLAGYWYIDRSGSKSRPFVSKNDSYLRARILIGNENRDDIETAISLLEQTVREDPKFASAWAQLARAYNNKAFYFAAGDERKKINDDAEIAAERSLSIDPNLADGHLARGLVLWTHAKRFPHDLAVRSYKRAIELDPNLDEAHHQLAVVYFHIGLFDKARAEIARTLEINPSNTLARFRYGVIDLYERKYEDAYRFFKSTSPDKTPALQAFQTATVIFKLGRTDEAAEMMEKYLRENPRDEGGVATSVKAMILAQKGQIEESENAIKRAEELGRDFGHFHHTAFNIASAYALMNKQDEAVTYLELAADDGFPCYPLFESDESFVNIRQNPRYVKLMAKLKQQWETYNATL